MADIDAALVRELSPGLLSFASRFVPRREDAEDLVQETWMSALRSAQQFEGRSSLRTWLVTILRRRISDRFRTKRLQESPLDEANVVGDVGAHEERLGAFAAAEVAMEALAELPPLERMAVELCDLEQLDREEVSQRMGITRGHLRVLLFRARQRLEVALRAQGVARR